MGADFYSSELYWNNLKPLDFEKGRQTAESIDDIEEKEKIIALMEKFEGYDLEGNFYHREGSVKEIGPISMLIAAYQGYGDPSGSNSLITEIDELSKHSEILNAIGFTLNPKELYREIAEKRVLPLTKAISKLTSIPDDVIEILSNYEDRLNLSGLAELSDKAAESLAKHQDALELGSDPDNLIILSDAAKESLAKYQGDLLVINGVPGYDFITHLSDKAAEYLSEKNKYGYISLTGLIDLSDSAAEILAQSEASELIIGLKHISDSAAENLSKIQGDIWLNDLLVLSDSAAESFSKHEGGLDFLGLKNISEEAARSLSNHRGRLTIGAEKISDTAIEYLSLIKDELALCNLESLSEKSGESLSRHEGLLSLDSIIEISDPVAEWVSKHQGVVRLYNLKIASPYAWSLLRSNPDIELPKSTDA